MCAIRCGLEEQSQTKPQGVRREKYTRAYAGLLCRWTIILIELAGIRRGSTEVKEGFHLIFHKLSSGFLAEIDLVFVNHHDAHPFPCFPARLADLRLHFRL